MEAECLVESCQKLWRERPDRLFDALEGNRTNLLGLRLGILIKPACVCRKKHLERVDAGGVRRYGHDCDDAAPETIGS